MRAVLVPLVCERVPAFAEFCRRLSVTSRGSVPRGHLAYRVVVTNHLRLLASLSEERRAHSLEVGRKAAMASPCVEAEEREALFTAATLHDIGYGHPVSEFHPLDGAAFLASKGYSPLVCHLVLA